ncbi:MAG: hypothetical protein CUN53_02410 [Phototrophicales bacterium]|nr:MAG: hypothetical protein CUN53_02410 [Phototrophicales bacterium]
MFGHEDFSDCADVISGVEKPDLNRSRLFGRSYAYSFRDGRAAFAEEALLGILDAERVVILTIAELKGGHTLHQGRSQISLGEVALQIGFSGCLLLALLACLLDFDALALAANPLEDGVEPIFDQNVPCPRPDHDEACCDDGSENPGKQAAQQRWLDGRRRGVGLSGFCQRAERLQLADICGLRRGSEEPIYNAQRIIDCLKPLDDLLIDFRVDPPSQGIAICQQAHPFILPGLL